MSDKDGEIHFAEGLIGLPGACRFQLLQREHSALRVLRCLDRPGLHLPVVDPFLADREYRPQIDDRIKALLGIEEEHHVVLLAIAVLQRDGPALANLMAPLVVNVSTCRGRQVIVDGNDYSTRTPIWIDADEVTQEAATYQDRRSYAGVEQTSG